MTAPVEYVLLDGEGFEAPVALAAECGMSVAELAELLVLAAEHDGSEGMGSEGLRAADAAGSGAIRLPVRGVNGSGSRLIVAVRLPAAFGGPGAPSAQERCFEAGLRLGAAAPGGRFWLGDAGLGDAERDALWRGAYLGAQQPAAPPVPEPVDGPGASPEASPDAPAFADGGEPATTTVARAEAAAWVRTLAERPANRLGPAELAAEIAVLAHRAGAGVSVEAWSRADAVQRGFGAVAAVGGGSSREPMVVHLSWGDASAPAERTLGLVGKGITFDSGGINLKRDSGELAWMKSDMAAAAAVAAAVVLASRLSEAPAGHRVEAILPLCDNALSGASMRPGDVVTHPGGETTEIVDTDCEGRLVLGDGVSWFRALGAGRIIDVGTLTDGGAGMRRTGLWSNDAELAAALVAAGDAATDPLWLLPLPYGESSLESRVADRRNAPMDRPDVGRHAAVFLADIAAGTPWAHYDIGGTAYLEQPIAGWPEGPTGAGTAALAEAVLAWADPARS